MKSKMEPIKSLDELMHMSQDDILMFTYSGGNELFSIAGQFSNYTVDKGLALSNVDVLMYMVPLEEAIENSKNTPISPESYEEYKKNTLVLLTPEYFADASKYELYTFK